MNQKGCPTAAPFGIQHKIHKIKIGEKNNEYTKDNCTISANISANSNFDCKKKKKN